MGAEVGVGIGGGVAGDAFGAGGKGIGIPGAGIGGIGMPGAGGIGGIGMPGAGGIGNDGRPGGGGKFLLPFFFLPSPIRAPHSPWAVICP